MKKKRKTIVLISFALLALLLGGAAVSRAVGRAALGPVATVATGTAFTYQGQLSDGDGPADGLYDLCFELYDDPGVGDLLGTVTVEDHPVGEGFFTVQLDFGDVFDGEARWLEVAVRPADSVDPHRPLSPRQALTPAPYALYAGGAPWSGLTDVPAGLDDGDDDTTYTAGAGLLLNGTELSAQGSPYANVLVVAQSGGDDGSIQAALDSITDGAAHNPYLVYVAPGIYNEQVTLKPYVTLEGAGEGTTIIRWTGGSEDPSGGSGSATLLGADNATIRHLTVESDGTGEDYAIAIYNDSASPTITHVTSGASGSTQNYGVYNVNAPSPTMTDVTATAAGGNNSYGVYNSNASPVMTNVTATGSDSDTVNIGVLNISSSSPTIQHSTLAGTTYSVFQSSAGDVKVANSQLIGPRSSGLICFNNYEENLDPAPCP